MSIINLPGWLSQHRFTDRNFGDLSESELNRISEKLSRFRDEHPDVSVVIPAWNEENNIYRTLSSLASNVTDLKVEIIVINNNSTDNTQKVLDKLGVINYFQPEQGITYARQMGLQKARGKYHLCADADTLYPPRWIELMTSPMKEKSKIVGVYGRYAFIPENGQTRFRFWVYEKMAGLMIRLRKYYREYVNVLGFTMGFVTEVGRASNGFEVNEVRKFDNALGSNYVEESEDGRMAVNLKKIGDLKLITHPAARVFTSSRRLSAEGGIKVSFLRRFKLHVKQLNEYLVGS